jgi:hypothetical protein
MIQYDSDSTHEIPKSNRVLKFQGIYLGSPNLFPQLSEFPNSTIKDSFRFSKMTARGRKQKACLLK